MFSQKNPTGKKPGLQPRCKPCSLEDTRQWRDSQTPERIKDLYYRRSYGMGLDEFQTRWANQGGKCAICSCEMVDGRLTANSCVVDHDHATGLVRGLLCNQCNRGIGYLKDDPNVVLSAAKYLTKEH